MYRIKVNVSSEYEILLDKGLLNKAADICGDFGSFEKIFILTDSNVAPLYLPSLVSNLQDSGYYVHTHIIEAGEISKSTDNVLSIINILAEEHYNKSDLFISFGGGVVSDLGGICAALYMRGMKLINMPTTLLACVDAAIGGKTGVNLVSGKNLLGSIYQPLAVICDIDTLRTLPAEIYADGMAEVIKYAMINDEKLFASLENDDIDEAEMIYRCQRIKADIVSIDENENGIRRILNYGHSFGHAIEKASNYAISHGKAVAMGMAIMEKACETNEKFERLTALLQKYDLPISCYFDSTILIDALKSDKKCRMNSIDLIYIPVIGMAQIKNVDMHSAAKLLEMGLAK